MMIAWAGGAARAEGVTHRFALLAGNARGGPGTRPLLYAADDARKLLDILTRLGSVSADDTILLLDGDAGGFSAALDALEGRARQANARGEKTSLVVYYSGHAKGGSLRLGESELPLEPLKRRLAQARFDVRIGIFDACQSGSMTRAKGARKAPAFEIDTQSPRDARGLVILTSSAADEDSQESDLIGGSYFSHHLASGLLGGADKSGDGRVTLSEAYAYAYERTVADTVDSAAGTQHPTFSYDLSGNGDLVLTDLGSRREGLVFPGEAAAGTYVLVDGRGFVAAEVSKVAGRERRVALAPGHYRIKRRLPDRLRVGEIEIPPGRLVALSEPMLRDAPFSDDPVKGVSGALRATPAHWSVSMGAGMQNVFGAPSPGLFPAAGLLGLDLGLRDFFRRDWVWGLDGAVGAANGRVAVPPGLDFPYQFREMSLATSLHVEWRSHERGLYGARTVWPRWVIPFLGVRMALLLMTRQFDDQAFPAQFFATVSPGLLGGFAFVLSDHLNLVLRSRLHYLLYNVDQSSRSLASQSLAYWEGALFVQYDFGGSR